MRYGLFFPIESSEQTQMGMLTQTVDTIRKRGVLSCFMLGAALAFAAGCPGVPDPSTGDPTTDPPPSTGSGPVTGHIDGILSAVSLSLQDPAISILYTVTGSPDEISGFYVRVQDSSPNAVAIGEPTSVASGLPATGPNTSFLFFPDASGVGFFRVGLSITADGEEIVALSDGVIQVQGSPDPCFVLPCTIADSGTPAAETFLACGDTLCDLIAEVDNTEQDSVNVSFDAGDPEGAVQWRLFYCGESDCDPLIPADQIGTEILTGNGNVGLVAFLVAELSPDDYQLGISATDSGLSVAGTVAVDGDNNRIATVFGPIVRIIP